MSAVIEASLLVKRYGLFTAVKGIQFGVQEHELFGLLGPNGAGKSSTMRMLSCVSPVTEGKLSVMGLDVMREPRRIKTLLGVVTQEDSLDEDLNVLENLTVYARYFGIDRRVAMERAQKALDSFQLSDKATAKVDALSGGMKRRLLIARALMNAPQVLVLDEPTTGLDPQARHLVWQQLRALTAQGVTIVLSTHSMEEAAYLCDRLLIMNQGEILAEGVPRELVERHVGQEVAELHPALEELDAVLKRLGAEGREVEQSGDTLYVFGPDGGPVVDGAALSVEVTRRPANLEDVFLRLTGRGLQE